ncbi:MAG: hypothetical protein ACJ8AS_00210 [Hyphomicrobiales bacterium]
MTTLRSSMWIGAAVSLLALGLPATAGEQTITAKAHRYVMPAGDHFVPHRSIATRARPLGYAVSKAELDRVKALRGAPDTADAASEAPEGARAAGPIIDRVCTTNSADMWTPSDIHGAVSPSRTVVVTNDAVGVYRRPDCTTLGRVSLEDFFRNTFHIPQSQGIFDPRVLYDRTNKRFMITAESSDDFNFDQFQYIAVSTNANATDWFQYQIQLSRGKNFFCKLKPTGFWDYPSAGQSANRWFITANDFPEGEPEEGGSSPRASATFVPRSALLSISKEPSLSGDTISIKCFNDLRFNLAPPIVLDHSTSAFFLSPGGIGQGEHITRYRLDSPKANATSDTLTSAGAIKVAAWTAAPNAPQPNGQRLDSLEGRFQSASIQDGTSLWNVHTINVNGFARWRLYKFSTTGKSPLFTVTPSTVVNRDDFLFNPSVTTRSDSPGNPAFVSFSRTIPSLDKQRGNAAMLIAKGPNSERAGWGSSLVSKSLDQYEETGYFGGSTSCNNDPDIHTCRWGDYSAIQIDPADPTHAVGFNQLIIGRTSKNWTTKEAFVH